MIAEKATLLMLAPAVIIVLVLAWLLLASARRKHVRFRLAGLGIRIAVDTSDKPIVAEDLPPQLKE